MREDKNVKKLAKEAKKRMKTGFWEKHKDEAIASCEAYKGEGVSYKAALALYDEQQKKKPCEADEFFLRVKKILDEKGEVSNVISLLTDDAVYSALTYEGKQKYLLDLSERYRQALTRYRRELSAKKGRQ